EVARAQGSPQTIPIGNVGNLVDEPSFSRSFVSCMFFRSLGEIRLWHLIPPRSFGCNLRDQPVGKDFRERINRLHRVCTNRCWEDTAIHYEHIRNLSALHVPETMRLRYDRRVVGRPNLIGSLKMCRAQKRAIRNKMEILLNQIRLFNTIEIDTIHWVEAP